MDVGDDRDAHQRILDATSPTSVGTVAGTTDVTTSKRPHAPAASPVATAARNRLETTTPSRAAAAKSSQPIVADPNVASPRRGMGWPAAEGRGARCSAVVAGPT